MSSYTDSLLSSASAECDALRGERDALRDRVAELEAVLRIPCFNCPGRDRVEALRIGLAFMVNAPAMHHQTYRGMAEKLLQDDNERAASTVAGSRDA